MLREVARQLQWGRNFIVTESHIGMVDIDRDNLASMGP